MRKPNLYTQIVLVLVLGAAFGAVFHADPRTNLANPVRAIHIAPPCGLAGSSRFR